jgi:hypothetical protein
MQSDAVCFDGRSKRGLFDQLCRASCELDLCCDNVKFLGNDHAASRAA